MVDTYGPILSARLYTARESDRLAQDIAEAGADPTKHIREYDRVVRAEGIVFTVTVLIVRRRLKVRDA